jgi:hypothetical protein
MDNEYELILCVHFVVLLSCKQCNVAGYYRVSTMSRLPYTRSSVILRNSTNIILEREAKDCLPNKASSPRPVKRRLFSENARPAWMISSTPKKRKKVFISANMIAGHFPRLNYE